MRGLLTRWRARTTTTAPSPLSTVVDVRRGGLAWARFLTDTRLLGVATADAERIADAAAVAATKYGCSYRMLLDYAFVHLAAGDGVDVVQDKVQDHASVSFSTVARWAL